MIREALVFVFTSMDWSNLQVFCSGINSRGKQKYIIKARTEELSLEGLVFVWPVCAVSNLEMSDRFEVNKGHIHDLSF